MAKRKTPRAGQPLPEEITLRRLKARAESMMIRASLKAMKSQLATYESAKVNRRNRDWKSPVGSADLAIIPDVTRTNARARQLERDTWIAKAAKKARSRNIVGRGIVPVPAVKLAKLVPVADVPGATPPEPAGEDVNFNQTLETLFWDWASNQDACDVEGRRTYWQMQLLAAEEKFIVGESFIVWSYKPNPNFVGLQLQMFEPEQLDETIQNYGGNQVRGGIEIDRLGKPVAYHFYERTQNDFLTVSNTNSIRITADRVIHYYRAERSQQTRGISELAPVMQDIRDLATLKDANLFRSKLEACIGFIVKQTSLPGATGTNGLSPLASGDTGTTRDGVPTYDVAPGMIPRLQPGEDIEPFIPSSPGTLYVPFTETTLRGIGAGIGLSYGALFRKSDSNYSAARQDMLEDERELGPEQDLLIDLVVKRVYELFVTFAIAENRVPVTQQQFLFDRNRYLEAEYITPARPWIDPEKEGNAREIMLRNKLITRSDISAELGKRFSRTLQRYAQEQKEADELGITFPEDAPPPTPFGQDSPTETRPKEDDDKDAELAARYQQQAADIKAERLKVMAPMFRLSDSDVIQCGTCKYHNGATCTAYDHPAQANQVCGAWEAAPLAATAPSKHTIQPPPLNEGEQPFDQTSSRDDLPS